MVPYRALVLNVQKNLNLSFDGALASVAAALRTVAHELTAQEATVVKLGLAPELRQVVTASRPAGMHDSRRSVELTAIELELSPTEAKQRILTVLDELRRGIDPWDDVTFAELVDGVRSEIDRVMVEPAVA